MFQFCSRDVSNVSFVSCVSINRNVWVAVGDDTQIRGSVTNFFALFYLFCFVLPFDFHNVLGLKSSKFAQSFHYDSNTNALVSYFFAM